MSDGSARSCGRGVGAPADVARVLGVAAGRRTWRFFLDNISSLMFGLDKNSNTDQDPGIIARDRACKTASINSSRVALPPRTKSVVNSVVEFSVKVEGVGVPSEGLTNTEKPVAGAGFARSVYRAQRPDALGRLVHGFTPCNNGRGECR
jgi:hypothetical protein